MRSLIGWQQHFIRDIYSYQGNLFFCSFKKRFIIYLFSVLNAQDVRKTQRKRWQSYTDIIALLNCDTF